MFEFSLTYTLGPNIESILVRRYYVLSDILPSLWLAETNKLSVLSLPHDRCLEGDRLYNLLTSGFRERHVEVVWFVPAWVRRERGGHVALLTGELFYGWDSQGRGDREDRERMGTLFIPC